MARKLKDTLPKKFHRLVEAGDVDALKEVFDDRALDARDREGNTALHIPEVPEEVKIWVLEQGADINVRNPVGDTPLHVHVRSRNLNPVFLMERGADVHAENDKGENAAYAAAFFSGHLRALIHAGADPYVPNDEDETPLMRVIREGGTGQISDIAELVRLLDRTPFTQAELEEARDRIIELGEQFENIREAYNEDAVNQAATDMTFLYEVFEIPEDQRPAQPVRHDGVSPIVLEGQSWQERFIHAWDYLVPVSGKAKSLQGEAIRIAGRIADEFHGNDGVNWDADFRRMSEALLTITARGTALSVADAAELKSAVKSLRRGSPPEAAVDTCPRLATKWVGLNPQPQAVGELDYQR